MMIGEIWIETSKGPIYARTAGSNSSPLVLGIHGWSQRNGWHTWKPLLQPLAEAGFFLVSVDMPGWGKSDPWSDEPTRGTQAVWAVELIIEGLGKDRAVLMGKSWGGGVAVNVALDQPGKIGKLILTAPAIRDINKLRSLTQPVLLVWAKDDPVIPFMYAGQLRTAIPNAQLVAYQTGGHSAAPNNASDFAPKAIAFLKK